MDDVLASEMYKEHILDMYKHPHNFGRLANATHAYHGYNPLCGDEVMVQIIVEDNSVKDVRFSGKGCAISIASASFVTDKIKGMAVADVKKLVKEDVLDMLHIPISPVRLKCALLVLETVHKTLGG